MKFLVYLMTMLFVGSAIAQNPTILQGSYISNVFGNSNFVLNPNAQTNIANVTTVTATVTRSTTTPLVATSEFTVAIGTANGTATWATRAFDAGMKNNNCEARFTYRGFAATSKVHIKQGANTVASLNLTPATDPRIASINFPCGDLSAATTFQVTDTAILAGTNEIGGIYVGLATNMANVAQAETVAIVNTSTTTIVNGASTKIIFTNKALDVYDEYNTATGIFKAKRAGVYAIEAMTLLTNAGGWVQSETTELSLLKNSAAFTSQRVERQAAGTYYVDGMIFGTIPLAVGDEIQLNLFQNSGANINLESGSARNVMSIKRFPSSSELVVTPERQNTFAGVKLQGNGYSNFVTTNAWAKFTSFTTLTRTAFGKAKVETNNDHSITIENMPVGNYYITATGLLGANNAGSGATTFCRFALADSATGGPQITGASVLTTGDATSPNQEVEGQTIGGIYRNTSVGNRTFFLQGNRVFGAGRCYVYTDSDAVTTISVIPLDQPSNSALYVQGPVKAAETGAAIPAGYVGEVKRLSSGGAVNVPANNTWFTVGAGLPLPAGVWSCSASMAYNRNGASFTSVGNMIQTFSESSTTGSTYHWERQGIGRSSEVVGASFTANNVGIRPIVFYSNGSQLTWPDGVQRGTNTLYTNGFLGVFTAGTPQYISETECVRLN